MAFRIRLSWPKATARKNTSAVGLTRAAINANQVRPSWNGAVTMVSRTMKPRPQIRSGPTTNGASTRQPRTASTPSHWLFQRRAVQSPPTLISPASARPTAAGSSPRPSGRSKSTVTARTHRYADANPVAISAWAPTFRASLACCHTAAAHGGDCEHHRDPHPRQRPQHPVLGKEKDEGHPDQGDRRTDDGEHLSDRDPRTRAGPRRHRRRGRQSFVARSEKCVRAWSPRCVRARAGRWRVPVRRAALRSNRRPAPARLPRGSVRWAGSVGSAAETAPSVLRQVEEPDGQVAQLRLDRLQGLVRVVGCRRRRCPAGRARSRTRLGGVCHDTSVARDPPVVATQIGCLFCALTSRRARPPRPAPSAVSRTRLVVGATEPRVGAMGELLPFPRAKNPTTLPGPTRPGPDRRRPRRAALARGGRWRAPRAAAPPGTDARRGRRRGPASRSSTSPRSNGAARSRRRRCWVRCPAPCT